MTSIVRGKVNRGDVALWDGKNATSSRVDASGGTVSGLTLNDFVDVLQVFGAGTAKTSGSAATAVQFVGTTTCTFMFAPGAWTFTTNVTFPSTVTCYIAAGAVITPSGGVTVTFSGPVIHEATTWTGGGGTIVTTLGQAGLIDLADAGGNYTATTVEAALAELASIATGNGASIIGLEDSGSNFTGTDVEAALAECSVAADIASNSNALGASLVGIEDADSQFTGTTVEAALGELYTEWKVKAADESVANSTTLQDDDELLGFSVAAGKRYAFEAKIKYSQSVGNFRWRLLLTTYNPPSDQGSSFTCVDNSENFSADGSGTLGPPFSVTNVGDGAAGYVTFSGQFKASASGADTLDLQWAQETSSANATTVLAGSWMWLRQLD